MKAGPHPNGSAHPTDAAGFLDLVRRRRERPDHRVDNLAGRERQNQQSQQQIKSSICHSESPRSGEDTPTRGCTKSREASLPAASPQDSFRLHSRSVRYPWLAARIPASRRPLSRMSAAAHNSPMSQRSPLVASLPGRLSDGGQRGEIRAAGGTARG